MNTSKKVGALVLVELGASGFSLINLKVMGALARLGEFTSLEVDLLVAGKDCAAAAAMAARVPGIRQVLLADDDRCEHQLPETLAPWLAHLAQDYAYVCVGATTFGKNLLPRIAALMDLQPVTDVVAIESANEFKRPVYAGSALAHLRTEQSIKLLSIRASAFGEVALGESSAEVVAITPPPSQTISRFISQQQVQSERPELTAARVVVSGGRGMQAGENFQLLYQLADKLGAAVGASRAAVDAGFVPNDMQVGQTGKVVAPELYIAVGLSGAVQHLAGMRDSRVVVAINKDADAPIFQAADYGLVADLFEAVPELIELL
uniref:electron transfer flavoprotein subunit alpha/FixB family protein n=1 Tax=Cellvibrio sp. OA-2007 TaxID=529823 RepID=UPI000780597C|nr:FAD-binding protein [Cellvibrio sp. OA-2007]